MLSLPAIVTSVNAHIAAAMPSGVACLWPGVPFDTDGLAEWIEIWCDGETGRVQRDLPPEQREISITVQVCVRPSANTMRVHELADRLRSALAAQVIPVLDSSVTPVQTVGTLRTREADLRELTRLHAEEQRQPLQHVAVLVSGIAQAVA
jgi:hypothetical protein